MLTQWNKLLNTDCKVVRVGNEIVYPIFRVGYTTLMSVCDHVYVNEQIQECSNVNVLIRDPAERFISGINEYSKQNNVSVEFTWKLVNAGKLYDRHFTPQFLWLMHLCRYYKREVTIRRFEYIKHITSEHKHKSKIKIPVEVCEPFVKVDKKLTTLYNQTIPILDLIRRYKNVLS